MKVDEEFYNKRRRQLDFFLNNIFNHHKLNNSKEFQKFLKDPECDEEFFQRDENIYDYPEASKLSSGVTQKFFGMFSNYFNITDTSSNINEKDRTLREMEQFYKNLLEQLKEVKLYMVILHHII